MSKSSERQNERFANVRLRFETWDEICKRGKAGYGDTADAIMRRALKMKPVPRYPQGRTRSK